MSKKKKTTLEKTTVLNGFHHTYPSNPIFERHIDNGRKEIIQLFHILPIFPTGGLGPTLRWTITVKAESVTP